MKQFFITLLLLLSLQPALANSNASCSTNIVRVMAAPEYNRDGQRPTSGWQAVQLPDVWFRHWPGFTGPVWYRVDWHTSCQKQVIAVNVQRMAMAGQVFLNDTLLWQDTYLSEPMSRGWNTPRNWHLLAPDLQDNNTLWFRLVAPSHLVPGLGKVTLGTPAQVEQIQGDQQFFQRQIYVINLVISLTLATLFGMFWVLRGNDPAFGWFALASFFWSFWLSNVLVTSPWPFESNATWDRLNISFYALYCTCFCMFIWSFGGIRLPRIATLLWSLTAFSIVVLLSIPSGWLLNTLPIIGLLYTSIVMITSLQFIVHAVRTRENSHVLLAACLMCCIAIMTHTWLATLKIIASEQNYSAISAPIISICLFLILAWRYKNNLLRIASFNKELQVAITHTREELTRTLQQENALAADNIRLNERLRMTHDLHDSLGSSLMHSINIVDQSSTIGGKQFLSILRELRNDLRHVIDGTSESTSAEQATPLIWISSLRRRFTAMFDDLGVRSEWHLPEAWPLKMSAAQLLELTRFMEEALTNILKHSQATHVTVRMDATDGDNGLSLQVTDNGRGFDVGHILSTDAGIGIHGMVRRIKRINGKLDITSIKGATVLTVRIPSEPHDSSMAVPQHASAHKVIKNTT